MEACIVIAQLVGVLYSEPIPVYALQCNSGIYYVIQEDELQSVNLDKQLDAITYEISYSD